MRQACANTLGPSCSMCSFNRNPDAARASTLASVAFRTVVKKRKARQQRFCSDRCSMRARSARYRQQIMTVGVLKNGGSYPYQAPATQPIQNVALTPLSPRYAGIKRFYEQHGRRIVVADMQLTMVSLAFLWLSVIGVI
jgi:hypothetical protein